MTQHRSSVLVTSSDVLLNNKVGRRLISTLVILLAGYCQVAFQKRFKKKSKWTAIPLQYTPG